MFIPSPDELNKLNKLSSTNKNGEVYSSYIKELAEEGSDALIRRYRVFSAVPERAAASYFKAFAFEVMVTEDVLYMRNMNANGEGGKGIPRAMWSWLVDYFKKLLYSSTLNPAKQKFDRDWLTSGEEGGARIWKKFREDEPRVGFDEVQERFYLDPKP